MRLTKLELKGFKSFRDKTALEFPDKFMGIVGPNGSGKSNITEAVCFVLGKSRGLRAANLQELIFNGGLDKKPSDKAVVTLTLKDTEGRRHKLARMVDRDGHSIYKLNDHRVTRQRIIDLVGDNEYNIILQDDVTKVIDMKPKERRTIIDDLCGIAEYDEKRDKSLNELKKVEERISETHIILGEKQGYLKELRKERDEALKYQETQETLKQCKATLLHKEIQSLNRRLEKIELESTELKAGREEGSKTIGDCRTQISGKNTRLKEISQRIVELEEGRRGAKITETHGEILRRQDKVGMLEERLKELEGDSTELGKLDRRLEQLRKDLRQETEKLGTGVVEDGADELRDSVFEYKSQVKALHEYNTRARLELQELSKEQKGVEARVRETSTLEQKSVREVEKKRREYDKLSVDLGKYEEKQAALNKTLDDLRYRMEAARIKLSEKQSELRTLERASSGLRDAVKAVMGLKKVLPGIHGTVSQLGSVSESKHELSMQVAAGGRMQYIVVDSVDTASKCIDYLRKKKVGRATFLPLDKLHFKAEGKPPSKSIGFARKFIKCDRKYRRVFDYVFGNTVIVKDIKSARAVGIGEWRMVTLNGDLIEVSGAMTGGFIKEKIEISFSNIEEIEAEIKSLQKHVVSLEDDFDENLNQAKRIQELIAKHRTLVGRSREELDTVVLGMNTLSEKKNVLKDQLKQLTQKISLTGQIIQENELKGTELQKTLNIAEKKLARMLEERSPLDRTVYDKLKDEIRDIKVEESRILERKKAVNLQVDENEQAMDELTRSREYITNEINNLNSEVKGFEDRLDSMRKQSTVIGGEIDALIEERRRIEDELTHMSEVIGETERRLEGINEKLSSYVIEKTKLDTRLEDLNKEYERYEGVELLDKSVKDMEELSEKMEQDLLAFGSVNLRAIETYDVVKGGYDEITAKLETLKTERQSIFDFMDKIEQKKRVTFMEAFEVVKSNFEKIFAKLSDGRGTLVLDKPMLISESGLIIKASPGGKKVMSLDAMSGGEKVLTSAAFLLAVQQYKPSYFYIVDELDAALDKANSIRLAEMLHASDSQFILVTHNNSMLRYMDSAIGVSMQTGISHIVGVKFNGREDTAA
jgi:chromosome segregation protein